MSHLNEDTLEKLISGSATAADVQRVSRHVGGCRACARRLEEWRDNFAEVNEVFPEVALLDQPATTYTPGGMVIVPSSTRPRHFHVDVANLLWGVALVMALVVGYGASRLRTSHDGLSTRNSPREVALPRPTFVRDSTPAGGDAEAAPAETDRTNARTPASPPPSTTASTAVPQRSASREAPAPSQPVREPAAARNPPAPTTATPDRDEVTTSPNFRNVRVSEAARRLGGRIRLLRGLEPDHVEIGPAAAVPGAQAGLDVVRVVYRTAGGGRILLDQQMIPVDASGFRPIDDPTLETGETAYGTAPNGVSVATWLDEEGYRLSLVVQAPQDSLRKLVPRVQ